MALVKEVSAMAFLNSHCIHVEQMLFWRMKRNQDKQDKITVGYHEICSGHFSVEKLKNPHTLCPKHIHLQLQGLLDLWF